MFRIISLLSVSVLLSSCAYLTEKSIQDLTILTPGAHGAECDVYVDGLRYQFFPPQTRTIFKTQEDLVIECRAPGNRKRSVVIAPAITNSTFGNVTNGLVPGMTWDYASGAMFKYPDTVTVDFTTAVSKPSPLPKHNNPDIKQPEDYLLEEFTPSQPRMNSDKYQRQYVPRERQPGGGFFEEDLQGGVSDMSSGAYSAGKGDLMRVLDNASAPSSSSSSSGYNVEAEGMAGEPMQLSPVIDDEIPN